MELMIIIFIISIWGLWKFIKYIKNNQKVASISYLLIFLGFVTILVSMYYPGGFEGMAIAIFALPVGIIGILWALIYTIIKKVKKSQK